MKISRLVWISLILSGLFASMVARAATVPILFNPSGGGSTGAVSVGNFDWAVGNSVALSGNPAGGLQPGSKVVALAQARLSLLQDPNGNLIFLPSGIEITFVAGFGEQVVTCTGTPCNNAFFAFDPGAAQNFFEIWVKNTVSDAAANNLAGTGFNSKKRILYGKINNATGNYSVNACPSSDLLDQAMNDDWAGKRTVCGVGATEIAMQVVYADPDYFPDFGPDKVANLKSKFTTQNVTPYVTVDPSRQFIGTEDPGTPVIPNLGTVNGLPPTSGTLDFQFQADANQSFEVGTTVPGACRVTYGGNDKNGNIAPNSFGSACMKVKGNTENCYTFGGQVGAPTADPAFNGPFGEHTHHQVSGPAGDFVFHAGTHSAPSTTRITATACYDPGACRQAEANAGFKQIDFEGTGSLRTLDATAKAYLEAAAKAHGAPSNYTVTTDTVFYFRVDMDDTGEPGNKASKNKFDVTGANNFFAADQNLPLRDPSGDPNLTSYVACNAAADVYQFRMCWDSNNQTGANCTGGVGGNAIYDVRGFLTGGNIQLHKIVK